jgi:dihydroorotate dehydrogenase
MQRLWRKAAPPPSTSVAVHRRAVKGLLALGFGHVEVGGVTPRAQPGNPRAPR